MTLIRLGRISRFRRDAAGVTMVEFALIAPVLVLMVFMVTGASMPTYASGTDGVTVVTSVNLDGAQPKAKRQRYSTTGTSWTGRIGAEGADASISAALLADVNDNVMVPEVFYRFTPLFSAFFKNGALSKLRVSK